MTSTSGPFTPRILVAPLDWGLGHATRCIPVVQLLLQRGATVLLAGTGRSGLVLRQAFPQLPYHEVPGHEITYGRSGPGLLWKILLQLPELSRTVEAENRWLRSLLETEMIHAVISDNRYGLHHPGLLSVFITHQPGIQTPLGALGNELLRRFHYRLINRFDACWIPDGAAPGLAGALSHPGKLPAIATRYIGPLSRFQKTTAVTTTDLAIVLSGPEPQRSIWEQQLLQQLTTFNGKALLVRGLPGEKTPAAPPNVRIIDHLPAAELAKAMMGASVVIARCGYSTVMDLTALQQRSILVPTPGQPEQEYLAKHLVRTSFAFCTPQKDFQLEKAIEAANKFHYYFPNAPEGDPLGDAVEELLERILKR
jgi:UDP:flavonoid glycosyltransferase YjiC (YdhE family)